MRSINAIFAGTGHVTNFAKKTGTMHFEGIPNGTSAMSRAVGLPMAVAARLVLEEKIKVSGAHIPPTLPGLYKPVLSELTNFGFIFNKKTEKL